VGLRSRWRHIALTAVLGLMAGLFAARLLAEEWPATFIALYEPAGAVATALLASGLLVLAWLAAHRLTRTPPDATPLLPLALLGLYVVQPGVNLTQAWVLLAGSLILCLGFLLTPCVLRFTFHASRFTPHASRLTFISVAGLAFLLYLRTLAPGVIVGDAAEFQTVLPTLGIAHPTGYPLYTLLGWLVTRVPFGEAAWRANLFSAVCGALAVGVVYLIAKKLVQEPTLTPALSLSGRGGLVAALAALTALTFAATPTWWAQCVMAEIYALSTLLLALAVYAALRWGENRALGLGPWALSFGFWVLGFGLAHHRTIVLLLPALLAYVLLTDWRIVLRPRRWLPALLLTILPLALYAYFPLRWPALHGGQPMTGEQFRFLVLAEGYAPALRLDAILAPDRWDIYLRLVVEQFGPAVWLAIPGAIWLLARRPRAFLLTGLLYVATVLFGLAYFVPDVSVFFIPAHLVMALWIGCGLSAGHCVWGMAQAIEPIVRTTAPKRLLQTTGLTVVALLPLALVWTNLPLVDLSTETAAQDWGEHVLSYPIGPNAVVICDVHRLAPLRYLAHGAGLRPGLEVVMPDTEAQSREIIAQALAAGRPVYLARFVPGLESVYALRSLGPLVEVSPTPLTTVPAIEHPISTGFGSVVRLLGYNSNLQSPISNLHYTLIWRTIAPIAQNLHPRLRLVDAAGRTWVEEPGRPPVDGLYPTTAWPAGSVVPDYHELTVPPGTPPGEYRMQVRLTPPFAEAGLLTADGSDAVTLETVTVPPATEFTRKPDHPARARFGNRLLVGYDQDEAARPGGQVQITLYWRALGPVEDDARYVIRWMGSGGQWEVTIAPALSRWQPGQVFQETVMVPVPLASQATGPGQLWLGWCDGGEPMPVRAGWLALPDPWCPLRPLTIAGTSLTGLANFGDQALLLDAAVSPTALSPGENLQVTLRWQCVGRMTADYTVFVHLLDAGERIHGQADAQPIYGTRPTSTWREGEVIEGDVYTFPVRADAPPGTYRLEVGLYDAATMTRLHVLGEDRTPIGDRVFVPQIVEVR